MGRRRSGSLSSAGMGRWIGLGAGLSLTLSGQPILAMPIWELLAPPPPLPPLPEAPARPKSTAAKPSAAKPSAAKATAARGTAAKAQGAKPASTQVAGSKQIATVRHAAPTQGSSRSKASLEAMGQSPLPWAAMLHTTVPATTGSTLRDSLQAASAPPALLARALRWEIVTPAGSKELITAPAAEEGGSTASLPLNPSTGFPTVARAPGLLWEVAPSPTASQDLLAIADQSASLLNSGELADSIASDAAATSLGSRPGNSGSSTNATASSTANSAANSLSIALATASPDPRQGLVQPPAPRHTASGLRWEPVEDPHAVLAEQPDPETLTTPVSQRYQPPFLISPYIGGAVPSAYVAEWGDFYISGSAATAGAAREENQVDGSFNTGMGFGDADRYVAIEVDWGIGSIKNFNFNGGFSGAIGRNLIRNDDAHLAISGGVIEFVEYGNEVDTEPATPYGALSLTVPLRPSSAVFQQRLQVTVGGGGAAFGWRDENFEGPNAGFFASLGLEITRNSGISAAWSGRGMNANFSYVPFRDIPVSVNVLAADLFNNSPYGRVGVLTLTWGSNFANGVF